MKNIILFLTIIFILAGCTTKERVVELKLPNQYKNTVKKKPVSKVTNIKPNKNTEENITVVEGMEPIDVVQTDITSQVTEIISDEIPTQSVEGEVQPSDVVVDENATPSEENFIEPTTVTNEVPFVENMAQFNVAIIYPSKLVAKYANSSISTVEGFLSFKKRNYNLKIIDSVDESSNSIQAAISKVKSLHIDKVIALYTPNAMYNLKNSDTSNLKIYLPLVEKKFANTDSDNFIFGSISYEDQFKKLLEYSNSNNIMFYQESFLGHKLKSQFESVSGNIRFSKEIKKSMNNFKYLINDYKLNNSSLFLNTDIVKGSIVLSQLRAYDINPKVVLSTQVNYDPLLMTLTQAKDRENFIIANSIDEVDSKLIDDISTFGGNVVFEWVDYSTLVGINYLYDSNSSHLIKTQIVDNQVKYQPRLFKSTEAGFLEIK